jgi:tRNA A37 threonylcarbamoyladenosine dehydratase
MRLDDEYVAFDIETTGLDARTDEIIEIGAVAMRNGEVVDKFASFANPGYPLGAKTVSLTNINRQAIAFHSTVGKYMTKVMEEQIKDICPQTEVVTHEMFVLPDNVDELFKEKPDYIIDAIDTVTAKLVLVEKAREYNVPIISSMGTGNKLHGELFEITDISKTSVCPLCKVMRKELKNRGIYHLKVLYSKENPVDTNGRSTGEDAGSRRSIPGSVSFVPPVAGLLIAGEVIRDICFGKE